MKAEGRVYLQFDIDKHGAISNIKNVPRFGYGIEDEAIRAIQFMPLWTPGKHKGTPVSVRYRLPVNFLLH